MTKKSPEARCLGTLLTNGADEENRTSNLLITMGFLRYSVMFQKRDFQVVLSHEMWVPPTLFVSLRFRGFQQFGDNWREFGEKNFSPKLSPVKAVNYHYRKRSHISGPLFPDPGFGGLASETLLSPNASAILSDVGRLFRSSKWA